MSSVQIGRKSYEMPPREGISIAHFLTVADIERSARYYEKVFGARILSLGDGNAPGYLELANIWMILNVGGGATPDKPTVTLSVPDPNHINSFMNFRVADIQACYELWKIEEQVHHEPSSTAALLHRDCRIYGQRGPRDGKFRDANYFRSREFASLILAGSLPARIAPCCWRIWART